MRPRGRPRPSSNRRETVMNDFETFTHDADPKTDIAYRPTLTRLAEEYARVCNELREADAWSRRNHRDHYDYDVLICDRTRLHEAAWGLLHAVGDERLATWWKLHVRRAQRGEDLSDGRRMGWFAQQRNGLIVDPDIGRLDRKPDQRIIAEFEQVVREMFPGGYGGASPSMCERYMAILAAVPREVRDWSREHARALEEALIREWPVSVRVGESRRRGAELITNHESRARQVVS
jgi:hypothetical protein